MSDRGARPPTSGSSPGSSSSASLPPAVRPELDAAKASMNLRENTAELDRSVRVYVYRVHFADITVSLKGDLACCQGMLRFASRLLEAVGSAQRGLFHGKKILHGNNVSHSERKTRRIWRPNVQVLCDFVAFASSFFACFLTSMQYTSGSRWLFFYFVSPFFDYFRFLFAFRCSDSLSSFANLARSINGGHSLSHSYAWSSFVSFLFVVSSFISFCAHSVSALSHLVLCPLHQYALYSNPLIAFVRPGQDVHEPGARATVHAPADDARNAVH